MKETNSNLLSLIIFSPIVLPPPEHMANTPFGTLFRSNTSAHILVVAIVHKEVDVAPFHIVRSPQIIAIPKFQQNTATGKLNAEITAIKPKGFHYSIMKWLGLSEGMTDPLIPLDIPQAISKISIASYTSPRPSDLIFPISKEIKAPKASFFFLNSSPNYLTISPL